MMPMNRWIFALSCLVICHMTAAASPAFADEDEKSADEIYEDAVDAVEDEEYRRALDLLDLAERKEAKPRFAYQRILVLEELGEYDQALELLEGRRQELAGEPGVGDLTALEQRLEEASSAASNADEADTASSGGTDLVGWGAAASGLAATVGGTISLLAAESQVDQLRCSGVYPADQRTGCEGVDAPDELTRAEFDERHGRIDTFRMLGGGLLGAGALAAGYAAYRFWWSGGSADASAHALSTAIAPDGGVRLQWVWRF